jgi:hypothetical protein
MPAVHRQSVSTIGCPPNPARRPGSRCPAVRCPARPVSGYLAPSSGRGCPAVWCPARPVSGRLVSVRPVAAVSSASAGWWRWGRPRYGGQRSRLDRVEFHVVRPRPRRLGRRPKEHGCGHRCEVGCRPAGERRPRTWAGWCFGGRLHPSDRAGQTAARGAVAGDCARAGEWLTRCCRTAPCGAAIWAWSHDYSAWSLRSLMSEWTGPEGPNELGGEDGTRPQRGPAR